MNKTFVSLTGGLGNQLFQLSAAINIAGEGKIILLNKYGSPREHLNGEPDLLGFSLINEISLHLESNSALAHAIARKGINFALSSGLDISRFRSNRYVKKSAESLTSLAVSIDIGEKVHVRGSRGIGFDQATTIPRHHSLLVGYMQSWRYCDLEQLLIALNNCVPKYGSDWYFEMRALATQENPLVVHVRLGDYRDAPEFGFPSKEYFNRAVSEVQDLIGSHRVWIFSDEPHEVLSFLPQSIVNSNPRIVFPPLHAQHPATSMAVMSLGQAFALTNSTFGYWAATLSGVNGSKVTIPDPWFANRSVINELANPSWHRLPR